jgi:hypothetical protein
MMDVEGLQRKELTKDLLPIPGIVIVEGFDWEQMN